MSTFVSVGNATQPFTRLLDAVCRLALGLPQPVFVQFGSAVSFTCGGCDGIAFLGMEEFAKRVAEAKLLILHAGAGSVIHAVRAGKVPVIMPRLATLGEHVDDHQEEFARALEKTGKVVVAYRQEDLEQAVTRALTLNRDAAGPNQPRMVRLVSETLRRYAGEQDVCKT